MEPSPEVLASLPKFNKDGTPRKTGVGKNGKPPPIKKKGCDAAFTIDIKKVILKAAARYGANGKGLDGLEGYLFECAKKYPVQYMNLLGRMIPVQMAGSVGLGIKTVNIISIPSDHFLTKEQIESLGPQHKIEPAVIEQAMVEVSEKIADEIDRRNEESERLAEKEEAAA